MNNTKTTLIKQIQQLSGVENVSHLLISPESDDFMVVEIYLDPELVVDRLTPEEVQLRNYNATIKRGLINDSTTKQDFIDKLKEEVAELELALLNEDHFNEYEELADISLVCDAYAYHYGIDLQSEKEKKMKINENRID